jgi:hypothetical protein
MAKSTKAPSRSLAPRFAEGLDGRPWQVPAWTTPERLQRIEAMIKRIDEYVRFLATIGNLDGTSAEAKDKAVAAFYERMAVLQLQLGQILEDFQLG